MLIAMHPWAGRRLARGQKEAAKKPAPAASRRTGRHAEGVVRKNLADASSEDDFMSEDGGESDVSAAPRRAAPKRTTTRKAPTARFAHFLAFLCVCAY